MTKVGVTGRRRQRTRSSCAHVLTVLNGFCSKNLPPQFGHQFPVFVVGANHDIFPFFKEQSPGTFAMDFFVVIGKIARYIEVSPLVVVVYGSPLSSA